MTKKTIRKKINKRSYNRKSYRKTQKRRKRKTHRRRTMRGGGSFMKQTNALSKKIVNKMGEGVKKVGSTAANIGVGAVKNVGRGVGAVAMLPIGFLAGIAVLAKMGWDKKQEINVKNCINVLFKRKMIDETLKEKLEKQWDLMKEAVEKGIENNTIVKGEIQDQSLPIAEPAPVLVDGEVLNEETIQDGSVPVEETSRDILEGMKIPTEGQLEEDAGTGAVDAELLETESMAEPGAVDAELLETEGMAEPGATDTREAETQVEAEPISPEEAEEELLRELGNQGLTPPQVKETTVGDEISSSSYQLLSD